MYLYNSDFVSLEAAYDHFYCTCLRSLLLFKKLSGSLLELCTALLAAGPWYQGYQFPGLENIILFAYVGLTDHHHNIMSSLYSKLFLMLPFLYIPKALSTPWM